MLRATEQDPPLPLSCFGQGVQSLAVVNIFRAFVDNLLQEEYEEHSKPILLMEEPESHLHPQATRAFYGELSSIPGQKIITTHSPYFIQGVPFDEIRLLRKRRGRVISFSIQDEFDQELDSNDSLIALVAKYSENWRYDENASRLTIRGRLSDGHYKELLACYKGKIDRKANHPKLKKLKFMSNSHIEESDLQYLQDSAKRIRGEIFFSRKWLLVEGPSDFIFMNAVGELLGYPLDVNSISVIDCQLHGKSQLFAALARAFGFPWAAFLDGDKSGDGIVSSIKKQNFEEEFVTDAVFQLAKKEDLEEAVVSSLPAAVVDQILKGIGKFDEKAKISKKAQANLLRKAKIEWSQAFQAIANKGTIQKPDLPEPAVNAIEYLKNTEKYQ